MNHRSRRKTRTNSSPRKDSDFRVFILIAYVSATATADDEEQVRGFGAETALPAREAVAWNRWLPCEAAKAVAATLWALRAFIGRQN